LFLLVSIYRGKNEAKGNWKTDDERRLKDMKRLWARFVVENEK
jgi:hypothetical protein